MTTEAENGGTGRFAVSLLLIFAIVCLLSVRTHSLPVSTGWSGDRADLKIENCPANPFVNDYNDLDAKQKHLIDNYYADEAKKKNTTAENLYDLLKADQKLHFQGITNAMEKTKIFDQKGEDTGKTVLDLIKGLDTSKKDAEGNLSAIRGKDISEKGYESYRIYVTYDTDAIDVLGNSEKNFKLSGAKLHKGMKASYRQIPGQPSLQITYNASKSAGEVDIDFDHGSGGVFTSIITAGSKGAVGLHNSDIEFKEHMKAYEIKYGHIPQKSPK